MNSNEKRYVKKTLKSYEERRETKLNRLKYLDKKVFPKYIL